MEDTIKVDIDYDAKWDGLFKETQEELGKWAEKVKESKDKEDFDFNRL